MGTESDLQLSRQGLITWCFRKIGKDAKLHEVKFFFEYLWGEHPPITEEELARARASLGQLSTIQFKDILQEAQASGILMSERGIGILRAALQKAPPEVLHKLLFGD